MDNLRWAKNANSQTDATGSTAKDSPKSDSDEKWKHETLFKRSNNVYQNPLKGFGNKCSNSLPINLESINNNAPIGSNRPTEPLVSNGTRNLENNANRSTESWKEKSNSVDKIMFTMLTYMNSLTGKMFPLINLQAMANPLRQIPTEVCRMANNINLNVAEILCRKRTETAVITWMVYKLKQ